MKSIVAIIKVYEVDSDWPHPLDVGSLQEPVTEGYVTFAKQELERNKTDINHRNLFTARFIDIALDLSPRLWHGSRPKLP